ncbi:conserved hypothetical protein, partial [Ricinus communis]
PRQYLGAQLLDHLARGTPSSEVEQHMAHAHRVHPAQVGDQRMPPRAQPQRQRFRRRMRIVEQLQLHRLHERLSAHALLRERALPEIDAPFLPRLLAVVGRPGIGVRRDPLQRLSRRAHHHHRDARRRRMHQLVAAAGRDHGLALRRDRRQRRAHGRPALAERLGALVEVLAKGGELGGPVARAHAEDEAARAQP